MQVSRVAPEWPVPSLMHRRRVMADCITYVGLDVHKEEVFVALAGGGLRGGVWGCGRSAGTPGAGTGLGGKLGRAGEALRFCYGAGAGGGGFQRRLAAAGDACGGWRP